MGSGLPPVSYDSNEKGENLIQKWEVMLDTDQIEKIYFIPIIRSRIEEEEDLYLEPEEKKIVLRVKVESEDLSDLSKERFLKIIGSILLRKLGFFAEVPVELLADMKTVLKIEEL